MAYALLIISIVCFIGGVLLFLIILVVKNDENTYNDEYLGISTPSQEKRHILDKFFVLKNILKYYVRALVKRTSMSIKQWYRKFLQAIQKRREDNRRQRDAHIQESSEQNEKEITEDQSSKSFDTSFLEKQTSFSSEIEEEKSVEETGAHQEQESQEHTSKKADSFVKDILSEDEENRYIESIQEPEVDTISDNYYYQYMEKRYIKKIMNNPKDVDSYVRLGDLYMDMQNYEDAYESYKTALKLDPDNENITHKCKRAKQKKDIMNKARDSYSSTNE